MSIPVIVPREENKCPFCGGSLTQFGYDLWELKCNNHSPSFCIELDFDHYGKLIWAEIKLWRERHYYSFLWRRSYFTLHKLIDNEWKRTGISLYNYPIFPPEEAEQQLTRFLNLKAFS